MKQINNTGCVTFQTETGFKGFKIKKGLVYANSEYLRIFDELKVDVI